MKGVILTGGTGSRLYPLTKVMNKNLLPVGNKPLIYYPIETLKSGDIKDILIITGTEHMGALVQQLGSGADLECNFTYKVQDKPNGIAAAVKLAKDFVGEDDFAVILGDNLFLDNIGNEIRGFSNPGLLGCKLFLKQVHDPQRFGVVKLNDNKEIVSIVEKPRHPPSDLAVTGLYLYTSSVFKYVDKITPSARGEYEISHVNDLLIKDSENNGPVDYYILKKEWIDAGTFESYDRANLLFRNRFKI